MTTAPPPGAQIHPRCPVCVAPLESGKCGLGCDISKCADCDDWFPRDEGCHHLEPYCAACFLTHCAECRSDVRDDMAAEAAWENR